jgi:hypothetical protein
VVHNLSLSPTEAPVEVSFYLGDPDRGGNLISDVNGKVVFETESVIGDQNYAIFSFQWIADFERFDRMYALIDPQDKMGEGREDNNKAWAPVQRYASCGEETGTAVPSFQTVDRFENRFEFYPNPADEIVYLDYTGPFFSRLGVTVFDLTGKACQHTELEYANGSSYVLDVSGLQPGMYVVSISTDHYRQEGRLVVE